MRDLNAVSLGIEGLGLRAQNRFRVLDSGFACRNEQSQS